jgi:hypothetical protein
MYQNTGEERIRVDDFTQREVKEKSGFAAFPFTTSLP